MAGLAAIRSGDITPISQVLKQAEQEGERLDNEELVAMVFLLLIAGRETTVYLLSNALLTMLQKPDVKDALLSDWSHSNAFIEEVLRYASPVQFAKPRFVAADTEFHGKSLKQGEIMFPVLAAANDDPQEFENPGEFLLDRAPNRHLSFGAGPHICLGLKLALQRLTLPCKSSGSAGQTCKPILISPNPLGLTDWACVR